MQIIKIILVLAAAALMYPAVWLISLAEKIPGNSRPPLAPPKVEL